MKIAVMSMGNSKESLVSDRFARSPFIVIYDTSTNDYVILENTGSKSINGAGPRTAELIIKNNIDVLLTIEIGVKAYSVVAKEHIKIELIPSGSTVGSAIRKFLNK